MGQAKSLLKLPVLTPIQVLIALPVIHVLVVCIFIASYAVGFGSYIGTFVSLDVIFSTSIRDIAIIYLTGLILPAGFIAALYASGAPTLEARADLISDLSAREEEYRKIGKTRRALFIIGVVGGIITSAGAVYKRYYIGDAVSIYAVASAWQIPLMLKYSRFVGKATDDRFTYEVVFLAGMLAYATTFIGIDRGNSDRTKDFVDYADSYVRCENHLVLRGLGSLYLAIDRNNRRALIDDDCKVKFRIPLAGEDNAFATQNASATR